MNSDMPNARFFLIAAVFMLSTIAILVLYARECYCETCPNRFAIWMRDEKQLCRSCKNAHDRHARRFRRRRSVPWRRAS